MSIEVRIDRLVLEGVPAGRADRVAADLKARLAERLAVEGAGTTLGSAKSIPKLKVQPVDPPSWPRRSSIGVRVADSVARELHR